MKCCRKGPEGKRRADIAGRAPPRGGTTARTARAGWTRRILSLFEWALPVTVLAVMPKCPACVAAYVVLFTGIGLSFSAAAVVRWSVIAISISTLLLLGIRMIRRSNATSI